MTTRRRLTTSIPELLARGGLLLTLLACHREPPFVWRFIADDAAELLTADRLYSTAAVFEWSFTAPRDLEGWTPLGVPAPAIHREPRGLIFDGQRRRVLF